MKVQVGFLSVVPAAAACLAAAAALGAAVGEPKRPFADLPGDVPREHAERVEQAPHRYEIGFRGAVDGTMTRMPIGYSAFVQGWQPNRSVRIENVGRTPVRNPRIVVNGRRRWSTVAEVVAEATRGLSDPRDRARAIWEFRRRSRFHATTWDPECSDLLKALNVYGYTLCGDEAVVINDLWKAAGLTTRRGYPVGHCVTEVFYDGDYHLLDSDEHVVCLKRDNRTIASEADVVRDHDLLKRTHSYGIGAEESRQTDEFSASLYGYEGQRQGDYGTSCRHAMDLVLRPGESIEYRWDHAGRQYTAGESPAPNQALRDGLGDLLAGWGPTAYDNLVNGRLSYRPDLATPAARLGAETADNARFDAASATIGPENAAKPAAVTWRFASPYVFVGGNLSARVRLGRGASATWRCSTDAADWHPVAASAEPGQRDLSARLDSRLSPRGKPTYQFRLQLVLVGDASAAHLAFEHEVQMAPLALPELEAGTNRIEYTDAEARRQVRVTHRWVERSAWHPPLAPAGALHPGDGQVVAGTQVRFQWKPAVDPDGDPIADYHFELSEHADVRWPLSPNFERLVSLTPARGKPEWTVPYAGLLNPQTGYYWRVRARDAHGVWGPWSKTFSFRARAPGVPLDVKLAPLAGDRVELQWRANPEGEPPIAYKVYGSNERGFTAGDREHLVNRGRGFVRDVDEFKAKSQQAPDAGMVPTPPNLIARVTATSLAVVGPDVSLANANRAYYRVVAIDRLGHESGPSDFAEVPRPFLVNRPAESGRLGEAYRFEPRVICSEGDLRCRASPESSYNAAYWDREVPAFSATRLPEGLRLDATTGTISGVPGKAGVFRGTLSVRTPGGSGKDVAWKVSIRE